MGFFFIIRRNDLSIEDVKNAGRLLAADAVVVSSLSDDESASFCLVDTVTGMIVANAKQSQPLGRLLVSYGQRERAMWITQRVTEDVVPVLYTIAGRPWMPPWKE